MATSLFECELHSSCVYVELDILFRVKEMEHSKKINKQSVPFECEINHNGIY